MSLEVFSEAVSFLKKHTRPVVLGDSSGQARVAVAPEFAGRVMFAAYGGEAAPALGWMNREAVGGKRDPKFVNFGGAERIWISPEGGQYCSFFRPGAPFDFENWRVPQAFNSESFMVVERGPARLAMAKDLEITNYLGNRMRLRLGRSVSVVEPADLSGLFGCSPPSGVEFVGYRTDNSLTNKGDEPLSRDNGLVSIWILCMFVPSAHTVVIAPVKKEGDGPVVIDDYFGKIPSARLAYVQEQGCVVFKVDGQERGKIGLPPGRARDVIASLDYENGILTVMKFSRPAEGRYLKNSWRIHKDPFGGDVINSYNDGPPEPGVAPLGGFYELENLSPARELGPGEGLKHWSTVLHFHGSLEHLSEISRKALGVDLSGIPKL
jgi:hypothetical protein